MDLKELQPVEGATLELLHPSTGDVITDKDGKPFTLTLLGADSDKWRNLQKRNIEKSLSGRKNNKIDLDDSAKKSIEQIAKCTTDCNLTLDGKKVKCDFEEMVKIYTDFHWIREQAEAFINDRANFIKS